MWAGLRNIEGHLLLIQTTILGTKACQILRRLIEVTDHRNRL